MEGRGRSRRRRADGCRLMQCSTPRTIVARLFSGTGSSRERREVEDDGTGDDEVAPIKCSTKRLNEDIPLESAKPTSIYDSPRSKASSFGMGIGPFLLYLVVASKTELDNMVELRKQMGMLLQNAKEEQQRRRELQEKTTAYNTNEEGLDPNEHQFPRFISNLASSIFEESSTSVLPSECADCEVSKAEECNGGTDASGKHVKHQKQEKLEDSESTRSHHILISGEVTDERDGVCPYELERKLHELLEIRQQEEIEELETALRRVERRLQEKEAEVLWWKDASFLLSQRLPESCRTGLECKIPESCRTRMGHSVPRSSRTGLKCRVSFSR